MGEYSLPFMVNSSGSSGQACRTINGRRLSTGSGRTDTLRNTYFLSTKDVKRLKAPALRRRMLTLFGSVAVTIMFLSYWMESRSKWMVLVFAAGSAATALYSALSAVYPITVIEGLWALVAVQRFWKLHQQSLASLLD